MLVDVSLMKSTSTSLPSLPPLILSVFVAPNSNFFRFVEAAKRRIHIPNDLDDVVDDEEDEAWKQWGKKSTPTSQPDPSDFSKMDPSQIQAEMMKQHSGPIIGFAKLRLGVRRTSEKHQVSILNRCPMIYIAKEKDLLHGFQ